MMFDEKLKTEILGKWLNELLKNHPLGDCKERISIAIKLISEGLFEGAQE